MFEYSGGIIYGIQCKSNGSFLSLIHILKMDYAQNMIVIKTLEGMGMAVAVALDNMQNPEILGTIAGDDTVFCVVRTHNQAAVIIEKLYRIIHSA